jgi:peptide/nickel transport system permease protein
MAGLFQGDLGTYGASGMSVAERISTALPITLQLTFMGLIIAVIFSVLLGVVSALYRDRWPDQVIRVFSIACIATPSFWLAVLMILLFSSNLHWLPASGPLPSPSTNFGGYLARMIMPAISLAVPLTGQMTRIVRTAMVEELDRDYVRTAKGSGLPKGVIIARNVLRNALITPVTTLGMKIGYLMGGAVVIEVIFNLPGMGMAILDGVSGNEPMLVMGVVIVVALSFIIINIVVDMLYLLINPRIRSV